MKNQIVKKTVVASVLAALILGGSPITIAKAETSLYEPQFVPTPVSVNLKDEMLEFTSSVNIKGGDVADQDALKSLKTFLNENSVAVNEVYDESATTIIIGESDDEIEELDVAKTAMQLEDADALKEEGYVLGVDDNTIVIEGKDGVGTYYGVQTLTQLSVNNGVLQAREAIIKDEPTMKTRGTIEGFYGEPWTHEDRLDQIKFYGKHKMNTYIYAPKDDVYHRENWRDPYPETEMKRMKELIQTAKENKVDFVFALSPGNSIRFTGAAGEEDFQALMKKCEAMYEMDVRSYAIFYDDITNKDGVNQAAFLNRFNNEFVKAKGDVTPLITVPTEYDTNVMSSGTDLKPYTKDFSETLDEGIRVLWTGTAVVPEGINVDNAQFVKSIYGDRVGIWWNYPVTDYITNKLALGPVYGLDKGLANELDFLVLNPMEHADLSKISIATGADYAWNTANYDYDSSFKTAINSIYGELAPYMYTFANHSSRLVAGWASTGRADAPEVRALMDTFIKKMARDEDASAEIAALTKEFDDMILAADTLKNEFSAEQLRHCSGNLDKLKLLGQKDKEALEVFIALAEGDNNRVNELRSSLRSSLSSLTSGKLVSEGTAVQFVKDALEYDPNPTAGFTVSNTFVVPGQEIQLTNTSSISSTNLQWTMKGANISTSTEENPVISYEKEGIYTIELVASNKLGESKVVKENVITVSKHASTPMKNVALNKSATATSYTAASEAPRYAIDGVASTKWCATGYRPHTLTIDLQTVSTIGSVVISHAEVGGEGAGLNSRAYRVQVSEDGVNYKEVVNVNGNTAGRTVDTFQVSLARYVKLIVDEPTQGGDSAARIYEVEIMGLDEAIELPNVYGDKEALTEAVAEAEKLNEEDYTVASWAVVEAALANAKAVLEDDAATQEEVDEATKALTDAIDALEMAEVSKTILEYAITLAEKISEEDLEGCVDAVVEYFNKALANAKEVYEDEKATKAEVTEAWTTLFDAMHKLDWKKADVSDLKEFVAYADTLVKEDYYEKGWAKFEEALAAAKELIADGNNMDQEAVNTALQELMEAASELRNIPDKSELEDLITKVEGMKAEDYTAESWAAVETALANAKAVYKAESVQSEVDAAMTALNTAIDNLKSADAGNGNTSGGNTGEGNTGENASGNNSGSTGGNTGAGAGTNTGDNTNVAGLAFLLMLSASAMAIAKSKKRS